MTWFAAKRLEILAQSDLASDHNGLIGSHRESVVRTLMDGFMPARLSVSRGLIYDQMARSHECDRVIWDSANFPRLPMFDHSAIVAESVAAVIEVKSNYSTRELDKARNDMQRISDLSISAGHGHVELHVPTELRLMQHRLAAVEAGEVMSGAWFQSPLIPYVLLVLRGGANVTLDKLFRPDDEDLGRSFPDVICFVDEGILVRRWEPKWDHLDAGEAPCVDVTDYGEHVLAFLASELLRLVRTRAPSFASLWDLSAYLEFWPREPKESCTYKLTHFPTGVRSSRSSEHESN